MRSRYGRCALGACLLLGLLGATGCVTTVHEIPSPCPERKLGCEKLATASRRHVYIFLMDGLDPCDTANLEGLRDYLCDLGFYKVWLGHFYHLGRMEQEILCRFRCDPEARFVLIGHGAGAAKMCELANRVVEPGVNIDLLVYLNPVGLPKGDDARPCNARELLNIGGRWSKADVPCADNLCVPQAWHFGVPSCGCVLDRIVEGVARLASDVPLVETVDDTPVFPPGPTPRPVADAGSDEARDEWDFLKPGGLHWTGRSEWDFLAPDLVQEVLAPEQPREQHLPNARDFPHKN